MIVIDVFIEDRNNNQRRFSSFIAVFIFPFFIAVFVLQWFQDTFATREEEIKFLFPVCKRLIHGDKFLLYQLQCKQSSFKKNSYI